MRTCLSLAAQRRGINEMLLGPLWPSSCHDFMVNKPAWRKTPFYFPPGEKMVWLTPEPFFQGFTLFCEPFNFPGDVRLILCQCFTAIKTAFVFLFLIGFTVYFHSQLAEITWQRTRANESAVMWSTAVTRPSARYTNTENNSPLGSLGILGRIMLFFWSTPHVSRTLQKNFSANFPEGESFFQFEQRHFNASFQSLHSPVQAHLWHIFGVGQIYLRTTPNAHPTCMTVQ